MQSEKIIPKTVSHGLRAHVRVFSFALFALCTFPTAPRLAAQITFHRFTRGPVIASANSNVSWHGFMSANPVVVEFKNTYFFYARGIAVPKAPSAIGVWTAGPNGFDGVTWNQQPVREPILEAGPAGSFDAAGIYDPSATVYKGKIYFYYGAHGKNLGLATSDDGLHFTKAGPISVHGGTPFPVVNQADGKLYLFYSQRDAAGTGWEYWVASSDNGKDFGPGQRVLSPTGTAGTFDNMSLITVRIWFEAPYYYMTYGGSPTCIDYPEGIGLARSTDLLHWERYPGNPVFERGPAGSWDEAALWSGSMLKINGTYFMWYEATGSAAGAGTPPSIKARDTCYGGYGRTSLSQVGVAKAPAGTSLTNWPSPQK